VAHYITISFSEACLKGLLLYSCFTAALLLLYDLHYDFLFVGVFEGLAAGQRAVRARRRLCTPVVKSK
jgi:hypothetical protein